MAQSTQCRACQTYFRLANGVVINTQQPSSRPRYANAAPQALPSSSAAKRASTAADPLPAHPKVATRLVKCFACKAEVAVPLHAKSSTCQDCSTYINLENIEVSSTWSREIKTRGSVTIPKKGKAQGISITCHDLKVLGQASGPISATGAVELITAGKLKIQGLKAETLTIGKKTELSLIGPAVANQIFVAGKVIGKLKAKGLVHLAPTAHVDGDIEMGSIQIEPGATHLGNVTNFSTEN